MAAETEAAGGRAVAVALQAVATAELMVAEPRVATEEAAVDEGGAAGRLVVTAAPRHKRP